MSTTKFTDYYKFCDDLPQGVTSAEAPWNILTPTSPSFLLQANTKYIVDTKDTSVTVQLPADPLEGQSVSIWPAYATFEDNGLIVEGNGKPIAGSVDDYHVETNSPGHGFIYVDDTTGWHIYYESELGFIPFIATIEKIEIPPILNICSMYNAVRPVFEGDTSNVIFEWAGPIAGEKNGIVVYTDENFTTTVTPTTIERDISYYVIQDKTKTTLYYKNNTELIERDGSVNQGFTETARRDDKIWRFWTNRGRPNETFQDVIVYATPTTIASTLTKDGGLGHPLSVSKQNLYYHNGQNQHIDVRVIDAWPTAADFVSTRTIKRDTSSASASQRTKPVDRVLKWSQVLPFGIAESYELQKLQGFGGEWVTVAEYGPGTSVYRNVENYTEYRIKANIGPTERGAYRQKVMYSDSIYVTPLEPKQITQATGSTAVCTLTKDGGNSTGGMSAYSYLLLEIVGCDAVTGSSPLTKDGGNPTGGMTAYAVFQIVLSNCVPQETTVTSLTKDGGNPTGGMTAYSFTLIDGTAIGGAG